MIPADHTQEAQNLCARNNLRFITSEVADENVVFVRGVTRNDCAEVWAIKYDDEGKHLRSERVLRFDMFGNPNVPLCLIDDARKLLEYIDAHEQRGLAVDPMKYSPENK